MDDMPQMPETTGFLEMFKEMMRFDLIDSEWYDSLSPLCIVAITLGSVAAVLAAGAGAVYYNWATKNNGWTRRLVKKVKSLKQD